MSPRFRTLSPLLMLLATACADPGMESDLSDSEPSAGPDSESTEKRIGVSPRANVNFAVGGATTNSTNATDTFAMFNPDLAGLISAVRSRGLDLIGLDQQLDFATATLNDVESNRWRTPRDVFWVYAGTNNYISGVLTGAIPDLAAAGGDPAVALQLAAAAPTADIGAALERLYTELGARRFVVPNLPSLADLPIFSQNPAFPPELLGLLTGLTAVHNAQLDGVVADFREAHADAQVVTADVFSIFQGHKVSGQYTNVSQACDAVNAGQDLSVPGACQGFLYLDNVHPSSSAWTPVAQAIHAGLGSKKVRRIITLGDSFSDLGSLRDTFSRGLGFDFAFPPPPFTQGRFTEGANVVQQVEELRKAQVRSTYFAQPLTTTETVGPIATETVLAMSGSVIIPKTITATGASDCNHITLNFGGIACWYVPTGGGTFDSDGCTAFTGKSAGDRVDAASIKVTPGNPDARPRPEVCDVDSLTIDWLHY